VKNMKLVSQTATHYQTTTNPLSLIESAARECYQSKMSATPLEQEKFLRKLIKNGHEAPLRFAITDFKITTDRGIMAEITRHPHASFCVESTRFCRYKSVRFILPVPDSDPDAQQWCTWLMYAESAYRSAIDNGATPQVARDILPLCTAVDFRMCANWQSWRHILRLRTAPGAHPKMIALMGKVLEWFRENYPVIVEDMP